MLAQYLKPLAENEFVIKDTQKFPAMLQTLPPLQPDEEDVSYDVESLFTSVPVKDTIDHICKEIYDNKKLQPLCSRNIFKKLLLKVTTECIFSVNDCLYKQTDGVAMGGPLSVVFTGCFLNKMENEIVKPLNPKFYRRYVDDTFVRRKKSDHDVLFERLNNFHPNIRLTSFDIL